VVTRYLRAYREAISVILRDKETTLKVMGKRMKMDNPKWVKAVYDDISRVLQRAPYMTAPEVQGCGRVKSPKGIQAKPEAFFDNSFLQKVEASGFINSLYAR
jgi:hypothetical protein